MNLNVAAEKLPEDIFVPATWEEVENGDVVYLSGTHNGKFRAYGPHRVVNKYGRSLRNMKDVMFVHYAEDLLKVRP